MRPPPPPLPQVQVQLDRDLQALAQQRSAWVQTTVEERIALLRGIQHALKPVCQRWADLCVQHKGIRPGSPLAGEEWLSGPYGLMAYCNARVQTLGQVRGKHHLDALPKRRLANGQLAVRVLPSNWWERMLLSGISVDVWMQPGVTAHNLAEHTAALYDPASPVGKTGKLALVLGAGNISSIAPLDALHKLFAENEVVLLKLNPINDYLQEVLEIALQPLIAKGLVRLARGAADVGQYLCQHPLVETLHITGAGASHDAIVWGPDPQKAKALGVPANTRQITSELGAVCPTIVVPGPWSDADIRFQAEHVATQKLHNAGFNCVACQVLVLPADWERKDAFVTALEQALRGSEARGLYYPGSAERLQAFASQYPDIRRLQRGHAAAGEGDAVLLAPLHSSSSPAATRSEVFGPALGICELPGSDPADYLAQAIAYANDQLYGTLGANIVIHPATLARIGRPRLEALLADLRYGTIAINAWTGVGFMSPQATWGAFPGHTLQDVQSGIGVVHNSCLFDRPERTVVEAPFRPFPRNLGSAPFSLLPRPPWFITHRRARQLGQLMTAFQYQPRWRKLPRIFFHALLG